MPKSNAAPNQPRNASGLPPALGPYSPAMRVAAGTEVLYVSGQISPDNGKTSVAKETTRALQNMGKVLKAGRFEVKDVAFCTLYLNNMNDFEAVNTAYAKFFGDHRPARACVEVSALPAGARVECCCVAHRAA